ncbi:MAG: hypothetical protein H0T96_07085 [Thermoleophilaceae bacterium]|nr:hypothetical protein [Thermoleophilaceae bacterium]MBA3839227.1 hypothetical protein [Thermoleophilaceae bacterium]MDQ3320401.1 hypothetical protein [Actinomycetota bacterium]
MRKPRGGAVRQRPGHRREGDRDGSHPVRRAIAGLAAGEPAGGAATEDLIPATIAAALLSIGAVAFGEAHRRGRTQVLSRLAAFAGRVRVCPAGSPCPR